MKFLSILSVKKTTVLAVAFLLSATGFSQKMTFGVRAGTNIANWKLNDAGDYSTKSKVGFEAGVFADINVSKSFSVQPEMLFSTYGTRLTDDGETARYNVNYLLVPVLAKYNLQNGLSFFAGPQVGILLSAKYEYDGEKEDTKDNLKKNDFFITGGAAYSFPLGVVVSARYNLGLSNIDKEDVTGVKNRSFGFSVGYKLSNLLSKKS